MKFEESLREGYVKQIPINSIRAKSLVKSSHEAINTAKEIPLGEGKLKSIFRELYEGFREFCEALGYFKGYKFQAHEVIAHFLFEILKEPQVSKKFDRYRQLRNGINYYGNSIAKETVTEALKEIPQLIKELSKHLPKTD